MDLIGYRKIVLLGVDLHTFEHFFDQEACMRTDRESYRGVMEKGKVFEAMIPRTNKYRTLDEYYYAVNELYFKPKAVEVFVGNPDNLLCPRIPAYPDFVP